MPPATSAAPDQRPPSTVDRSDGSELGGKSSLPTVLAIGPVPPPINGMSMAFDLVVRNLPSYGWNVRTVDSADRTPPRVASAFSFARASGVAQMLVRACRGLSSADVVYVTIAQSRWGFAKDVIVLSASAALGRPVIAHMHGGNF